MCFIASFYLFGSFKNATVLLTKGQRGKLEILIDFVGWSRTITKKPLLHVLRMSLIHKEQQMSEQFSFVENTTLILAVWNL